MNFLSGSRLSLPPSNRRSPSIQITDESDAADFWTAATQQLRYIDSVDAVDGRSEDSLKVDFYNNRRLHKSSIRSDPINEPSEEIQAGTNRLEMNLLPPPCSADSRTESLLSNIGLNHPMRPQSGISRTSAISFKRMADRVKMCSWVEGESNQRRRQSSLHQNMTNAILEVEQTFLLMEEYQERKDGRYYFQHPIARLLVCSLVTFCNFLMFAEDPVSHSRAESVIPIMGNVFSFLFTKYPPEYTWSTIKVLMWTLAILLGLVFGKSVIHPFLSRVLRLKMFRDDQGSWMTMFLTVLLSLYICSHIYNIVLYVCRVDQVHRITSQMYVTNASLMKAAACGTWLGDLITALMVTDMMLQDTLYPDWAPRLRRLWRRSNAPRILLFWVGSALATVVVLTLIISDWISWDQLNHDMVSTTEVSRAYLASSILVMDLVILMQDWDFPHFTTTLHVNLPGLKVATLRWNFAQVRVTGKWFNYGIIFCVMIFDLNMWKNQIFYDPSNYGQYIGEGDKIHTVIDRKLLQSGNSSLWTYRSRLFMDIKTGKPFYYQDRIMNSRYLGYSMLVKWTSGVPSVMGLVLFVTLIALYGRFPDTQGKQSDITSSMVSEDNFETADS